MVLAASIALLALQLLDPRDMCCCSVLAALYRCVLRYADHAVLCALCCRSREFHRYYKQRPRLGDGRESVQRAAVVAQYRRLAVPLLVSRGHALLKGGVLF